MLDTLTFTENVVGALTFEVAGSTAMTAVCPDTLINVKETVRVASVRQSRKDVINCFFKGTCPLSPSNSHFNK